MRMNSFLQSKGNGKCIANFTSIYRTRETVFALKVCNIQIVCDSQGSYTVYLVLDRLQHVGPGFVDHSYCKATLEI